MHGPELDHVQVLDVEVLGQVSSHPDVFNPEELNRGGGPAKTFQKYKNISTI